MNLQVSSLDRFTSIVNQDGTPSLPFHQLWQSLIRYITNLFKGDVKIEGEITADAIRLDIDPDFATGVDTHRIPINLNGSIYYINVHQ